MLFFFLRGEKEQLLSCVVYYITNVGKEMSLTSGILILKKKYPFLFRLIGVFLKKDVAGELH